MIAGIRRLTDLNNYMQSDPYKQLIITGIQQEVNNVKLFFLLEKGGKINYRAGQYLTFILPGNENEIRRSYSLASSPDLNEPLCIGVKRINNGAFSRHLSDRAKVGDEILTTGAGGVFVLPQDIYAYHQVYFFAAGSGIVPVFSLMKTALYKYPHLHVILIYSNSSRSSAIFHDQLTNLDKQFKGRFSLHFIFSDSKNLFKAHLHADLIEQFIRDHSGPAFKTALYYICGPEAYMRLCTFSLNGLKVPSDHIKKEIFHSKRSVQRILPPDKAPHDVTLLHGEETHTVRVQHPESILAAARKQGLVLPYSCEVGRCGNCIAKCVRGKIWMSYNEVLTDRELSEGFILTCTGYPVEGDAAIHY